MAEVPVLRQTFLRSLVFGCVIFSVNVFGFDVDQYVLSLLTFSGYRKFSSGHFASLIKNSS